jgi:hypothetical protein
VGLEEDNLDDGGPLLVDAARVETFGRMSAGSIAARIAQRRGDRRPSQFAPTRPSSTSSPRVGYELARRDARTNAGTALADWRSPFWPRSCSR